ncbi:MAG: hypothetical protein D6721_03725 [Gammaproteobacteria bacterium]|nr:MAG: hypothetical protein D6721_03725 [Gammaproteobacteria bacterium]
MSWWCREGEAGSWKLEARSWKLGAGSWELGAGRSSPIQDLEDMQWQGCRHADSRISMSGKRRMNGY